MDRGPLDNPGQWLLYFSLANWSRWALGLSCGLGLGVAAWAYSTSPAVVPVHFDVAGAPNRWGTSLELMLVLSGIHVLVSALFLTLPALLNVLPASLVNLPNRDYWLAPAQREQASSKFSAWAGAVGSAVNLMLIATQLMVLGAARGAGTLPSALLAWLTSGFVLFVVGSIVWLVRSYRLPAATK